MVSYRLHLRCGRHLYLDLLLFLHAGGLLLGQEHQGRSLRQPNGLLVQLLGVQHPHRFGCLGPSNARSVATTTS